MNTCNNGMNVVNVFVPMTETRSSVDVATPVNGHLPVSLITFSMYRLCNNNYYAIIHTSRIQYVREYMI